jgi:hypothetical protein
LTDQVGDLDLRQFAAPTGSGIHPRSSYGEGVASRDFANREVRTMRNLSACYLMIAGTYTPLALGMQPRWGAPLLMAI